MSEPAHLPPQASIIVPVHNAARFIGAALDSVLSAQDRAIEVVVVDDRSSDGSLALVACRGDERVRVIRSPGEGIAAALNAGLAASRGSVVMRCDADDVYAPGRIRQQLQWLQAHTDYGALCGAFSTIDAAGKPIIAMPTGTQPSDITGELLAGRTRTHLGTFAVRSELARRLGGFRPFFATAEDIDFQLRLAQAAAVMYLPAQYYHYRVHDDSITHTQARARRRYYERTARRFLRQRTATGQDDLERGRAPVLRRAADAMPGRAGEQIAGYIAGAAWAAHAAGDKRAAIAIALRALRYRPVSRRVWRDLLVLLIKPARAGIRTNS